ncbi:hypothetical protein D5W64_12525 [Salmonella enterica subsp. enterica serovar Saintpaul]|nr:hypothetical protein [Salmonella enterica subsp. enterica serovar Saintpaul]
MKEQSELQYRCTLIQHSKADLLGCIEDALEQMIASRNWKTYLTSFDFFHIIRIKKRMNSLRNELSNDLNDLDDFILHNKKVRMSAAITSYNTILNHYKKDIIFLFDFCRKDISHMTDSGLDTFNALTYGGQVS